MSQTAIRLSILAIALVIGGGSVAPQWAVRTRPWWLTACAIEGMPDPAWCGTVTVAETLSLPLFFSEAARGRYDTFAQAYVLRARTLDREIARGVHLGVYCAEDLPFVDGPRALEDAAGTRIGPYLLDEYRRACELWPRAAIPSSFRDPITVAVPSLLMSGRRDPVTPPRTAEDAAHLMSWARVLVWKYGGHGTHGLIGRECWTQIVRDFIDLADPNQVSVACMDADPRQPFRLSSR